jgi:four helix bundle protein
VGHESRGGDWSGRVEYAEWERKAPSSITEDRLWSVTAHRLALYLVDLGWGDVTRLAGDRRTVSLSNQLYRSLGSISANLAEGYSRSSGRDRARLYEYALGSARESRGWYLAARHLLGDETVQRRMDVLAEIIRLVLVMLKKEPRMPVARKRRRQYS